MATTRNMVEVRYRGSPGDNLFQYCFGRLVAERWGYELSVLPMPRFPATAERVAGQRYLSPFQSWSGMAVEERQLGMLLRGRALETPPRSRLVLYGWFQRWEYYRGHDETIRRWLRTDLPEKPADGDDFAICLRTRRPEAWREPGIHAGYAPSWARPVPSAADIQKLVDRVSFKRLVVLSDDPHSEAVMALKKLNPTVMAIDSFASWNWLRTCRRMAITTCHASDWWAAWLSEAQEIFAINPWQKQIGTDCLQEYG